MSKGEPITLTISVGKLTVLFMTPAPLPIFTLGLPHNKPRHKIRMGHRAREYDFTSC